MKMLYSTSRVNICAKNLSSMAKYAQNISEVPQIPMEVLGIDAIGHLHRRETEGL